MILHELKPTLKSITSKSSIALLLFSAKSHVLGLDRVSFRFCLCSFNLCKYFLNVEVAIEFAIAANVRVCNVFALSSLNHLQWN